MVFTNITPFPTTLTPVTNISPLTYRDAGTFLEYLETIKQWLNETLVPDSNAMIADAILEFQTGIANAEATITTAKAGWTTDYTAFTTSINASFETFKTTVNAALAASEADITAEKVAWQASFDAFMVDVQASLAPLNDAAIAGLVGGVNQTTTAMDGRYPKKSNLMVNVKDYGAKGDGIADDTAAFVAAAATDKTVYVPRGQYKGSFNLDVANPRFVGEGVGTTIILPTAGNFFIDSNQIWVSTNITGITFDGGKGHVRNRYAASNVTQKHNISDNLFINYTGAAISCESEDMPLWSIEKNSFRAASHVGTVAIALNGLTDTNGIRNNEFQSSQIYVKLGKGGNNAYITHNDFVQYGAPVAGLNRAFIWVVPSVAATNAGAGLVISDNKYGNENLGADDYRIVYADESAGAYFGDRLPNLTADSVGFISGHTIRGGLLNGNAPGAVVPFIYSTTKNLRGNAVHDVVIAGTVPAYIVKVRTVGSLDPESTGNTANGFRYLDSMGVVQAVSNQPGLFRTGMSQFFETNPESALTRPGGQNAAGYVNLLANRVNSFTVSGGGIKTPVTDSLGGTDAVEFDASAGYGIIYDYPPVGKLKAGVPVWIEFELKAGVANPMEKLVLLWTTDGAGQGAVGNFLRVNLIPTTSWVPYRFQVSSPITADNVIIKFGKSALSSGGQTVQIGRVRVYHSREPVTQDLALPNTVTSTVAPVAGAGAALPATPAGYVTVFINGVARQIPYY